jgi:hypothetical protein
MLSVIVGEVTICGLDLDPRCLLSEGDDDRHDDPEQPHEQSREPLVILDPLDEAARNRTPLMSIRQPRHSFL